MNPISTSTVSPAASNFASSISPGLPISSPEAQGISSLGIRNFVEAAGQLVKDMHSLMIVRNGHIVSQGFWPGQAPEEPHVMWSLTKSFTSIAIGMLVAQSKLSVDDTVLKFFPELAPAAPSDKWKAMRVRDLLTMTTGHETEPKITPEIPWEESFFAHPLPHKPGTHFLYNSAGSHMLSAILQKVSGETMLDFLRPRLFDPLGIENPQWDSSPQGVTIGGWGLHIRTEDIARFGQMLLQGGEWNNRQIVPASWVEQATTKQVSNGSNPNSDWDQGYGFQFWRCRHNAYRGDGKDGQFCIVLPELGAVVVMTAQTPDMGKQLGLVWDKLLPAFHSAPLAANASEEARLQQTLESLSTTPRA